MSELYRRDLPPSGQVHLNSFDNVPSREIVSGFHGRYVHSPQVTIGRVDIVAGSQLPAHAHPHEQWTTVLSGSLTLVVDGVQHVLHPGMILYIPPDVVHSGQAHVDCQVLDVFCPPRDDYR